MLQPIVLSDLELMELHVDAEFASDARGRMLSVNEPNGSVAPRFFLGLTTLGIVRRYRHDVPEALCRRLEDASATLALEASAADVPLDPAPYQAILAEDAPVERTSLGLAFRFPATLPRDPYARLLRDASDAALLEPLLRPWIPDLQNSQPLIALVVDGRAVSVCGSVRITPRAHEAGVETAAAYRGRRYAARAVTTWAAMVRERGVEPLYSTSWSNGASRSVARELGLVSIGSDLHIT